MRAALSAIFLAVANAQSSATTASLQQAIQACQQPISQQLQSNQQCQQQVTAMSQALTGSDQTALANFCTSPCLVVLNSAYVQFAACMRSYKPQLIASLQRDMVANATNVADNMLRPFELTPEIFNMMCTRNERGDFCMPLFARMGSDMRATTSTPNITTMCNVYYNTGCCLNALDHLYATFASGVSFIGSLSNVCPRLVDFSGIKCLAYGQKSVALTVAIPMTGLNCAAYNAQPPEFRTKWEVALRNDLSAKGVSAAFITVRSVAEVQGVCTVTLLIRANSDPATMELKTAAATVTTATLTESNSVLQTAPTTTTGTVTMGSATVAEVTLTGQSVGSTGSSVVPSFLVAAFLGFMWLA